MLDWHHFGVAAMGCLFSLGPHTEDGGSVRDRGLYWLHADAGAAAKGLSGRLEEPKILNPTNLDAGRGKEAGREWEGQWEWKRSKTKRTVRA